MQPGLVTPCPEAHAKSRRTIWFAICGFEERLVFRERSRDDPIKSGQDRDRKTHRFAALILGLCEGRHIT
jgi:hypothetical protein